jgi:oligopeptide transport system ATP-binding protein
VITSTPGSSCRRGVVSPLLEIRDLHTHFFLKAGVVKAVDGVSCHVAEGETLGVVGESGCGKSVTALSVMRLVPDPPGRIVSGEILFSGRDLVTISDREMRGVRGKEIAMIFQDPMTSLNPVFTIGRQITESLKMHLGMNRAGARRRAAELLQMVGIPSPVERLGQYPHQLSGGMRQRVMISIALACNPKLIIADEPTTALDVTIQAQIVDLVKRLCRESGTAVVWITHDLGVVAGLCDRVVVMYAGRVVEMAPVKALYAAATRHPYTLGLLRSTPRLNEECKDKLTPIEGQPPDLLNPAPGCAFAPRCFQVGERCKVETPRLAEAAPGHLMACWYPAHLGDALERCAP